MEVFEVVSKISDIETMAWGHGIKILPLLLKKYGGKPASWRKKKGRAIIRQFGMLFDAELHWYEAHGIGKVNMKIKHKKSL
jgi:hypothetical protein